MGNYVSVEGVTRDVPKPFLVIATQNPAGSVGTQLMPEAQVDRFMVTMTLGYPDFEHELAMAMSVGEESRVELMEPVIKCDELLWMQHEIHQVYMKEDVYRYLLELVTATRSHPYLERGASPRATIALVKMAKSAAWFNGRNYVTPNDVIEQFPYTVLHRVSANTSARMENIPKSRILKQITATVKKPPMGEKNK